VGLCITKPINLLIIFLLCSKVAQLSNDCLHGDTSALLHKGSGVLMSEKVDIFMPIIWADYEKKTSGLSMLEHGAYLLLLKEYWNNGGAIECERNADASIMHMRFYRSCRALALEEQVAIDFVLSKFFVYESGKYHQSRADEELEKAREKRRKAKEAAEKRWKKEVEKPDAKPMQADMQPHMQMDMLNRCSTPTPTLSPIDKISKEGSMFNDKYFLIDEFVLSEPDVQEIIFAEQVLHPKGIDYLPDCFLNFCDEKEEMKLWSSFYKYHQNKQSKKTKGFWILSWKEHIQRQQQNEVENG
jgi:uncharacterized protein YdaU (DUF1376 family)